ncbi:MAG: inorganic phosphate transporter [Kineosporiaceae bacterium]
MDLLLFSVIGVVALALLFDFTNGFHDAANSVATVVATRAMSPRMAVWFSAACNFAAFFVVGTGVANTVAKTVKPGQESVAVVFSALLAAIAWNYITWNIGMPSSSSHAVIGGLLGAGIAAGGLDAVNWNTVSTTALGIIVSPAVAFTIAALGAVAVRGLQKATGWKDDAKPFQGLQLISAAALSFGHGANDAQKTMGVIAAVLAGSGYLTVADGSGTLPVPDWVALAAYSAIALGTIYGGWRIIETMGLKITRLTPSVAVAANLGAVSAIFGATRLEVPISTTHAAASSVVGAGTGARRTTHWKVVGEMAIAWVVTLPAAAAMGFGMAKLTQLPTALAWITVGGVVVGLAVWIIGRMRHTTTASDVTAELEAQVETTPRPVEVVAAA